MNIIDLATKTMQTSIKSVVDTIKVTTDATKSSVDTVNTKSDQLKQDVTTVSTNVAGVKTVVDATKVVVDSTETKVDTIDTKMDGVAKGPLQQYIRDAVDGVRFIVDIIRATTDETKGTVNTLNTNVGVPTTTASNATSANAHAKLNHIVTTVGTINGKTSIRNVSRGTKDIPSGNTTIPISITSAAKATAFVSGTPSVYVVSMSSSSLVIYSSTQGTISWEVAEFN